MAQLYHSLLMSWYESLRRRGLFAPALSRRVLRVA
jgi:hypothetical protein